jgi:hypothetical protein
MERAARSFSLDVHARTAAALGCELSVRLYPVATISLRDRGQLDLAQAIAAAAHMSWRCELEVPIASGDMRATDLLLSGSEELAMVEIFRSMADLQAQLRPVQLKRETLAGRHQRPVRLIISVPDVVATRRTLRSLTPLIARTLPVQSRDIWNAIRNGSSIGGDGILFVRPRSLNQRSR